MTDRELSSPEPGWVHCGDRCLLRQFAMEQPSKAGGGAQWGTGSDDLQAGFRASTAGSEYRRMRRVRMHFICAVTVRTLWALIYFGPTRPDPDFTRDALPCGRARLVKGLLGPSFSMRTA